MSRLLTPDEIGIFSVSISLIGFAHILRDFGVGQYLIQSREIDLARMRAAFTVMLLTSWTIALGIYLVREPVAHFYDKPGMADVLGLIALNFLLIPFGAPIMSVLNRELLFGRIALVNLSNNAIQHAVTIACAFAGLSYMSLAWGSIAGMLSNVIILSLMRPQFALLRPTMNGLRNVMNFGYKFSANSLVLEFGNNAGDLIFGRTLGFSAVAYFSRSLAVLNLATGQVLRLVNSVFLPAFAAQIRSGKAPAELYAKSITPIVGITVPLLAFVGLMAEPLIDLMFGSQWEQAATLASILSVSAMLGAPFALIGTALVANGQVGLHLKLQVGIQCIRIPVLLLSIWLSLEETIVALVVASALFVYPQDVWMLKKAFNLSPRRLWAAVRSAYLLAPLSLLAPAVLRTLDVARAWNLPDMILLCACGALFGVSWLAAVFLIRHPLRDEVENLFTTVFSRRSAG
ncbi:conserved hypotheitcal polysaccharide biosynthesis protein [Azoarcus olearius]|uniref:Conserved hypotheitcal polysaccharide biosynthesis protein n=1 Tax=Azoarcus sp. (strain BH72) TaxID=418699 RepID=A1KAL6_AZOSB|nr:conserved hypotheitcal polysaccharide biosynthesis protein [Azoarcus olearius]